MERHDLAHVIPTHVNQAVADAMPKALPIAAMLTSGMIVTRQ
jgi:hypothetical protein